MTSTVTEASACAITGAVSRVLSMSIRRRMRMSASVWPDRRSQRRNARRLGNVWSTWLHSSASTSSSDTVTPRKSASAEIQA